MEKYEVIGCYNRGKHYIETCLEQIASLEQSNDKELRQALMGTYMVEVSYKAADNFVKVCGYVINGEDGADKLKGKLYDLKDKVRQLYDSADKHNLITIKDICDSILREIGEVEEWANDNESGESVRYPEIPIDLICLFPNKEQCVDFVKRNYGKPAKYVVNAYMEEKNVVDPTIPNNSIHAKSTIYHYFVEPFDKSEKARTGFYKLF